MGWPKGMPRGTRVVKNINPESAVDHSKPMEPVVDESGNATNPASPHLMENKPVQRAFNDRSKLEEKIDEFYGLDEIKKEAGQPSGDDSNPAHEGDKPPDTATSTEVEVNLNQEPKKEEPPSTPEAIKDPTPPPTGEKFKTKEDAEKAAKEAERKMHEATQEAARVKREKDQLESFNSQMIQILTAIQSGAVKKEEAPKEPEKPKLTKEEKVSLMLEDPDAYEQLVIKEAEERVLKTLTDRGKQERIRLDTETRSRVQELFIKTGNQHFEDNYQDMKVYEPYVSEEATKILQSPEGRELIATKGPVGLVDKAVENTKVRIEQIAKMLREKEAGLNPPASPGETRTALPASPVVTPKGMMKSTPIETPPPTMEQVNKESINERRAWQQARGLG